MVGSPTKGCHESRKCSRDIHSESHITKHSSIRRKKTQPPGMGRSPNPKPRRAVDSLLEFRVWSPDTQAPKSKTYTKRLQPQTPNQAKWWTVWAGQNCQLVCLGRRGLCPGSRKVCPCRRRACLGSKIVCRRMSRVCQRSITCFERQAKRWTVLRSRHKQTEGALGAQGAMSNLQRRW